MAIGVSDWRAREAKNIETYGSARWAQPRAQAGARYDNFVSTLGRRLNEGPKLRQEIPEDVLRWLEKLSDAA